MITGIKTGSAVYATTYKISYKKVIMSTYGISWQEIDREILNNGDIRLTIVLGVSEDSNYTGSTTMLCTLPMGTDVYKSENDIQEVIRKFIETRVAKEREKEKVRVSGYFSFDY